MSKQCLDMQQMQHLQELGLDTSNASMYWINYNGISVSIPSNFHLPTRDNDYVICDAYTLQDVLDALPKMIYPFHVHKIGFELWIGSGKIFYANMFNLEDVLTERYDKELIDAAYELLVWCIELKFVETNKNEYGKHYQDIPGCDEFSTDDINTKELGI